MTTGFVITPMTFFLLCLCSDHQSIFVQAIYITLSFVFQVLLFNVFHLYTKCILYTLTSSITIGMDVSRSACESKVELWWSSVTGS